MCERFAQYFGLLVDTRALEGGATLDTQRFNLEYIIQTLKLIIIVHVVSLHRTIFYRAAIDDNNTNNGCLLMHILPVQSWGVLCYLYTYTKLVSLTPLFIHLLSLVPFLSFKHSLLLPFFSLPLFLPSTPSILLFHSPSLPPSFPFFLLSLCNTLPPHLPCSKGTFSSAIVQQ